MEFLTYELINQKKKTNPPPKKNPEQTDRHDIHYKTVKLKTLFFYQFKTNENNNMARPLFIKQKIVSSFLTCYSTTQ